MCLQFYHYFQVFCPLGSLGSPGIDMFENIKGFIVEGVLESIPLFLVMMDWSSQLSSLSDIVSLRSLYNLCMSPG
jgi:hypothetical protein